MGLKNSNNSNNNNKNETNITIAKLLLYGVGAIILVFAVGFVIRIRQLHIRKRKNKEMYMRRIGAYTTPAHGDPEAGEIA